MGKVWGASALLVLPLLTAMLAGCASCESGPPVSARGMAAGPAEAGSGDFGMDLLITDGPGGPPLAGAGVVVYWTSTTAREWTGPLVEVEGGPSGGRVSVNPQIDQRSVEPDTVLRLVTGPDGVAHARVPPNRIVGFVAAKDGFTEEWVPALATGESGRATYALPLYRQHVAVDVDRVWGPGAASSGFATSSNYQWDPSPIPFGDSEEANRGYAARIVEMTITVSWENTVGAYGDLAIGLGPLGGSGGPAWFRNGGSNVAPGAHVENATILLDDLARHDLLAAPAILAGAATETGFVAPFGMPYTIHVEARFDRAMAERAAKCGGGGQNDSDGAGAGVPGVGALGAVAALAGVALVADVARRRRR